MIDSIIVTDDLCAQLSGRIEIHATSPASPTEYAINGAAFSSDPVFTGLAAGTYLITVRDSDGCTAEDSVTVGEIPAVPIQSLIADHAYCDEDNGSILVLIPSGTSGINGYSIDGITFRGSPMFSGLAEGEYTIWLRSHGACLDSATTRINQFGSPQIDDVSVLPADCHGDGGSAVITASGGSGALSYNIDGRSAPDGIFPDLPPGIYTVAVIDSAGCEVTESIVIGQEEGPVIDAITITVADCGATNGAITVSAHASNGAAEIFLDGAAADAQGMFSSLAPGAYHLLVRDSDGCTVDSMLHLPARECPVYIPNVFTPNGDGINDLFAPMFTPGEYTIVAFRIYDRWGNTLFDCAGDCRWDGTYRGRIVAPGVYVYDFVLEAAKLQTSPRVLRIAGDVTLAR